MFERQSALADARLCRGRDGTDGRRRLKIGQAGNFSLVHVRGFPGTLDKLESAIGRALGIHLPSRLGESVHTAEQLVLKIGPERFWIIGVQDHCAETLRGVVFPTIGSITTLSHARACLFIEGPQAREVLSKGIAVDLHPNLFYCGACALTGLQQVPVMLHRADQCRYELYVPRTSADWIWGWLEDAALPLGYETVGAQWTPPAASSIGR